MALDLTDAYAKIDRARELQGELAAALTEWQDTGGVEVQSRRSLEFVCYIGYVKVNTAPPINLALRAGEVLHALRTALDYTAFQIHLANGGAPADEKAHTVQFPIVTDPEKWAKTVARQVHNAWPAAVAELHAVQQFELPPVDPPPAFGVIPPLLSRLATLGGTDKHRNLSLLATAAWAASITAPELEPWCSMDLWLYKPGPLLPLVPGKKVAVSRVQISPAAASHPDDMLLWTSGVELDRPDPPDIMFGFRANDGTQIDVGELPAAIDLVESILDRFATLEGP